MGPGGKAQRTPAPLLAQAAMAAVHSRAQADWFATSFRRQGLSLGRIDGLAARPRDLRPADGGRGERILDGEFTLGGETLRVGRGGNPWNQPSPSRAFAETLHGFAWMADLLAAGPAGQEEALRLTLEWRRPFGAWNTFAWSGQVLERRVAALACSVAGMIAIASDAEAASLLDTLARQAGHLLAITNPPARAAERAAVAATAATALAGRRPEKLLDRALRRLERLLPVAVLPDGVHASRSPQVSLELLFDLLTLDDALSQRGRAPPTELARATDRLTGAVRFLTLGDGRLAAMQGGADVAPATIAAALAHDDSERPIAEAARHGGYHRLEGGGLQVFVDGGAPAHGPWSVAACAAPGAIEVVADGHRLITSCAWSPDMGGEGGFRFSRAASTLTLDESSPGEPVWGFAASELGPRLTGASWRVRTHRGQADEALVLGVSHDGWLRTLGLTSERTLYLDRAGETLRGEDRFKPTISPLGERRRVIPYAVRFHLGFDVRASVSADGQSVLIRDAAERGWWLRTDATAVTIEPSTRFQDGAARAIQQIVLAGHLRVDKGGRVRWKLERDAGA